MEFTNFKAYDHSYYPTDNYSDATFFVIFDEQGYRDAIQWGSAMGDFCEVRYLEEQESHYYEYDCDYCIYRPMDIDDVPASLKAEFVKYSNQTEEKVTKSNQKFKVKIQLVNGVTIEPNLYSSDFHEIADIIQRLSCEKLFAGQIKSIRIE